MLPCQLVGPETMDIINSGVAQTGGTLLTGPHEKKASRFLA